MSEAAGSRILVISSTSDRAQRFIQRVKALSAPDSDLSSSVAAGSNTIPWTIANKYYTADVHFEAYEYKDFGVHHAIGVPAIIYVWAHGEPYKEHIAELSRRLEYHDPEVSLGVRLGDGAAPPTHEDEDGLDEFLSSHGFEFIEGERSFRRPTQDPGRISDDEDTGVPGLPRVVDALSTIMWPTMVQSESTRARKSRARELLDWARDEEGDDGLQSLIAANTGTGDDDEPQTRTSRMQREMEELERWLAAEDDQREAENARAWVNVERPDADADADVPTPLIALTPAAVRQPHRHTHTKSGFDDDFTDFVSAPAPAPTGSSLDVDHDADRLVPSHTGASYQSLASVSDFDEERHSWAYHAVGEDDDEDDDDPELPSKAEIAETSRQIFGVSGPLPNPDVLSASASWNTDDADADSSFDHPDADEDDFELSAFDLSRVLHALQGMKQEIAGMEDGPEKRRAAAKVALGLVYGLQAERGDANEETV